MKTLIVVFACLSLTLSGQFTYWAYNGSEAFPNANVFSIIGFVEDSVLRITGSIGEPMMRGYQGTFRLSDGSRLTGETSEYFDYCYPAAGGFPPQSFIPMPDGGYITMRGDILASGWDWPRYIRFNSNLDTLWVKANLQFDDPDGSSFINAAIFILPIDDDRFLSICFVDASKYRFSTHSMETGEILTNHLWEREEVVPNGEDYLVGIRGGLLTEDDSVFVWGGYYNDVTWGTRYQMFYAKFDLLGNLGSYYLDDTVGSDLLVDDYGEALLENDTITVFFIDAIEAPVTSYTPFTCQVKAHRLNSLNLGLIEAIHIPLFPIDNDSHYNCQILQVESTQDGGYLVTVHNRPTADSTVFYVVKINEAFTVEWYTEFLSGVNNAGIGGELLAECPDRSIIVGGTYFPSFGLPHEYFIKLDACGYMVPSDCPEFVSVADGEIRREGFRLWPNPGTGAVDAIVPFNARQLQVVDASGRCVYTEDLYYPRQTWQLTHLPNGVYTFIVHTEDGRKHHQRWVKQ